MHPQASASRSLASREASIVFAASALQQQTLSGLKRLSVDGEESAAAGSSRLDLPPKPTRNVRSRGSSPPAEPSAPLNNEPSNRHASGSSQQPKERCQPARCSRASGQREFPALRVLNTAPRRNGSALDGGSELGGLLNLASTCVEAEGASVISLPGPAAQPASWLEFARNIKPSHAIALYEALCIFHKSIRHA